MKYSTLLDNLEKQLEKIQRSGKVYVNIPALSEVKIKDLSAGLQRIVPRAEKPSYPLQLGMSPSELHRQNVLESHTIVRTSVTPLAENPTPLPPPPKQVHVMTQGVCQLGERNRGERSDLQKGGSLEELREIHRDCMRCPLGKGRTKLVFGTGSYKSPLMFIGEGPGADEDAQGEPFVGRAGKLLTKMINSIGIDRRDVYITNVVKCRPPGNRNPEPAEVASCMGILESQLQLISPRLIVTLGNVSTRALIPDVQGITKARGKPLRFREWTLLPTFHPSYLLRNRTAMPLAWKDFRSIATLALGSS